jgi:hypothetical protein
MAMSCLLLTHGEVRKDWGLHLPAFLALGCGCHIRVCDQWLHLETLLVSSDLHSWAVPGTLPGCKLKTKTTS